MRILTYNVGGGRKAAPSLNVSLLESLFDATEPDLVSLQEVSLRSVGSRQLYRLLSDSGFPTVLPGFTLTSDEGDYGNLVLVRGEVTEHRSIILPSLGNEPRGAIICSLEKDGFHWTIASTHLGLRSRERLEQLGQIRGVQENMEHQSSNSGISLLVGDLNIWNPLSRENRLLKSCFDSGKSDPTFPTIAPLLTLDRVWSRNARFHGIESRIVIRSAELRHHSDHYPLLYQFQQRAGKLPSW